MKINFNSIISKTLTILFISSIIYILFISIGANKIFGASYKKLIDEKISITVQNISPSLALNLSFSFTEAIQEIGNKAIENPDVLLVKIESKILETPFVFTKEHKSIDTYKNNGEFISQSVLVDPITSKPIGKMTLVYSKKSYEQFMNNFYLLFFSATVGLVLSILTLAYFLYKSLKPLTMLATSLRSFNPNNPKKLLLHLNSNNEISSIASSANDMINNLVKYLNDTQDLNKEISQKQSHLKEAQRIANVGSWEYDIVNETLILSDEIYRILGLKKSVVITWQDFIEFISSKDREFVVNVFKNAMKNGSNFDIKFSLSLENNRILDVRTRGKVRKKIDGSARITAVSMDITQDNINKKMIEKLAYYDSLTSLPNRVLLKDRAHKALQNAHRNKQKVAMIFLDLDHFKLINDTLGHTIGDKLLIYVSKLLQMQIRESDTLSRIGGDEFVILLPNIHSQKDVEFIAKKILESLYGQHFIDSHQLYISTSIGIAIYPDTSKDMDELITNADTAMYDAKQDGRNNYKIYQKAMGNHISTQMKVEQDLKNAVNNKKELEVYYQAKVDAESGQITGAEALVRWNHPERGLVFPDDFIGVAESTGIILELGNWIIEESISQVKEWNRLGYSNLKIAVNLSGRQFQDMNLVSFVASMIRKYAISPSQLEFEITETLSMSNVPATLRVLDELKNIGVSIAIDDFGTGYSSLSYLKQFPINTLKIDKSFVMDMIDDEGDKVIVQTIISMAHSLGFKTVAEGVESLEHVNLLRNMGCDELQGYYYSKAVTKYAFTLLLEQ